MMGDDEVSAWRITEAWSCVIDGRVEDPMTMTASGSEPSTEHDAGCPCCAREDTVRERSGGERGEAEHGVADNSLIVRVEAEAFRSGGQNVAYFDTTSGNQGGAFRTGDVDIAGTGEPGGGFCVGWIAAGEWLTYDIVVPEDGVYALSARVAAMSSGSLKATVGDAAATLAISVTGGWQTWQTQQAGTTLALTAGTHRLKVDMLTAGFNVDWLELQKVGNQSGVDNPVVTKDDSYTTKANAALSIGAAAGLLANDMAADGGLQAISGTFTSARGGSVTVQADGSFSYSPPAGYTGSDSFSYTARDVDGDTATATATIAVAAASTGGGTLRVEAEAFRSGGQNVAYFDTTSGNQGGAFRTSDVDIAGTGEPGGGFCVGWIAAGEWLTYDIVVPEDGVYALTVRVAAMSSGSLKASVGGTSTTAAIAATGGYQSWQSQQGSTTLALTAGQQVLKLDMLTAGFNVDWLELQKVGDLPANGPATNSPPASSPSEPPPPETAAPSEPVVSGPSQPSPSTPTTQSPPPPAAATVPVDTATAVADLLLASTQRWNSPDPYGTADTVTYAFLTSVPNYYSTSHWAHDNFRPFTAQQQDMTRKAIAEIESFSNLKFVETTPDKAAITFGVANITGGYVGYTYYPSGSGVGRQAGDVWLDDGWAGTTFTAGTSPYKTLVHELGHAIGLDHPSTMAADQNNRMYTVMSYSSHPSAGAEPSSYMQYDIASIQYIYGANTGYRTGNDAYSYTSLNGVVRTLWDAGGIDTIDASAATVSVTIDLRAGQYSSIGASRNIGIASGVVIENARGGSGNDTLVANQAANTLTGGSGADIFAFKSGFDNDSITDFENGIDHIDLRGTGLSFAQLTAKASGANTVISDGQGQLTLLNVAPAHIDASDFYFDAPLV